MSVQKIVEELRKRGQDLIDAPRKVFPFTHDEESDALLNDLTGHPHAFVLACLMDRQIKAEKAWIIPFRIQQRLGSFDIHKLAGLSLPQIRRLMTKPEPLHRFNVEMSKNFHEAIATIQDKYGGNAATIWNDTPPSAELVYRFLGFRGMGPKIATMAANILVRHLKIRLSDYYSIDVSVDVHVRRVLTRLGLIAPDDSVEDVVYRVRGLCPDFPGIIDSPAWELGRACCHAKRPSCGDCYMAALCPAVS